MEKNILNEIETMKYLLGYKKGVVISEQNSTVNAVDSDNNVDPKLSQTTTQEPAQTTTQQPAQQQVSTQINVGVKNPSIEGLQNDLNTKFKSGLVADGKYGPKTANAILTALKSLTGTQSTVVDKTTEPTTQTTPTTQTEKPESTQTQQSVSNTPATSGNNFSEVDLNSLIG